MSVWVQFGGHNVLFEGPVTIHDIQCALLGNETNQFYFTHNGKTLKEHVMVENGIVRGHIRILGGKGGFGSMLRAIGAQIEKTTNREACRDLSGRRLRDINEEKRLKNWIAQQAEREREAAERRKKKLERLCNEPKHDFSDEHYEKARTELTDKVYDAVEHGFRSASVSASSSTTELKRKLESQGNTETKKKKTCLWVDDIDEDDLSSDSDSDSEETQDKKNVEKLERDIILDCPKEESSTINENCTEGGTTNTSFKDTEVADVLQSSMSRSSDANSKTVSNIEC